MKRALCINSIEDISNIIHGNTDTIDSSFVDRSICEDPNNKFLQLIPYVTFYTTNFSEGKIRFIQYRRTASGNEDRLLSKASIGFGGHIDQLTDIKATHATTAEDGTEHFVMTKQDLVDTLFTAAKRELIEELGVDILSIFNISMDFNETAFFMGDTSKEVNQVHLGFSIPIRLTNGQYDKFLKLGQFNKAEIDSIENITINIQHIIEEMDITITINKITRELEEKHNFEDWSCRIFDYITRKEISMFLKDINYNDLYRLSIEKQSITSTENTNTSIISTN